MDRYRAADWQCKLDPKGEFVKYDDAMAEISGLEQLAAEHLHSVESVTNLATDIIEEKEAQIEQLIELSKPFVDCACSDIGKCHCHNCKLRDYIEQIRKDND